MHWQIRRLQSSIHQVSNRVAFPHTQISRNNYVNVHQQFKWGRKKLLENISTGEVSNK